MVTIEELKNNFSVLERSILDGKILITLRFHFSKDFQEQPIKDVKDPTEDIQVALTWIDYIQNPSRTDQEKALFFGDALPKLLKAVFSRKYDSLKINIAVVLTFLENIASLLAKSFSIPTQRGFKEAPLVLKDLLDPSNQFYKKCATLLANKQAEIDKKEGKKVDNFALLDSLETGSYVDYYNSEIKKWEPVVIERFSDYRTECEICLPNEVKTWIVIDEQLNNLAPFGTKTSFSDSSTVDATVESKTNSASEDSQNSAVVDVSDNSWKSSLSVGSLIDCKDKNNLWFQACILDIEERREEMKVEMKYTVTEPLTPLPAALLSQLATAVKPTVNDADLEDIYDSQSAVSTTSPLQDDPSVVNTVPEEPIVAPKNEDSSAITAVEVDSNSSAVAQEQITMKKFIRVAFVGLPEKFDEWIDITDDRIQKLNLFSFGRRGENPIREEVLTVAASNRSDPENPLTSPEDVAVFRPGLFVDQSYVKIVNAFGAAKGFDIILNILSISCGEASDDSDTSNSAESNGAVSFSNILQLIVSVGNAAKVLCPEFLSTFAPRFLNLTEKNLSKMSLADIRETSIETLEQVFHSIESVAVSTYGRTPSAGQLVEPVKLDTAIRHISSPFLNRRLGGLKILSDLVRRAVNATEFPTGWRITRTVESNGDVSSSYSVVPILYAFTPSMIAAQLAELSVMATLFEGASSHESLMQRAGLVLRAMASTNNITPALLDTLWNAGVVEKKAEALKVVVELIESINPSLLPDLMQRVSAVVKDSSSSANFPSIIDLSSAVIIRCKSILLTKSDQNAAAAAAVREGTDAPESQILAIYNEGTDILFNFIVDIECDETVVQQSLQKLEATLTVTKPSANDSNPALLWKMQFSLLEPMIKKAINNISKNQSVCNMLRLLQILIIGWPQAPKTNRTNSAATDDKNSEDQEQTGVIDNRSELVKYLESQYGVLDVVTNSIVLLKRDYGNALFSYLSLTRSEEESLCFLDGKTANDIIGLTDVRQCLFPINDAKVDTAIGKLKVGSSRFSYLDHLSRLFDFIHVYARCSDMVQLSLSTVEKIVFTLVYHSVTVAEHETLISFVDRLVFKNMAAVSSATTTAETAPASSDSKAKEGDSSQIPPKRKAVTSNEALRWVFLNVLCDEDSAGLLNSSVFSMKTFNCIEKWFVWLNADLGYIKESGSQFTIVENTESLIGADVFLKIILNCPSDAVALQAVKFLTLLPQHFSPELVTAATNFRTTMLSKCMDELQNMHTNIRQGNSSVLDVSSKAPLRLPRIIMFLEGILEESQSLNDYRVVPHGSIGVGPAVVFHISSTSKRLKQYKGEISMRTHQTVGDLMQAVAKQVHMNISEIRVYRLGKQINSQIFHKTISQMQMLGSNKENLVVAEWPLVSDASKSVQDGEKDGEKELVQEESSPQVAEVLVPSSTVSPSEVDKSSIPALVLANSKTYFNLLFALLEECSGTVCDKLWALISKLPTPISKLKQFAMLECESVKNLLMDSKENLHPTHLLYNLQLIEVLMQPSESESDFQLQRAYIGEIDYDILESWPERFDQKKGFSAICYSFEWLQTALQEYIHGAESNSGRGVTSGIFQQATSLITKLMRGLIVKYTAKVISTDAMEKILSSKTAGSSTSAPTAASTGEKMIGCEPPPKAETAVAVRDASSSSGISRTEWGWRIQIHLTDLDISMLHLQKVLVTLISLLRKLGEHVDYITTSADSSVKSKFAVKHTSVIMILEDLLIIWKCCIVCETDILDRVRKSSGGKDVDDIDTLVLIQEIILGQFTRSKFYHSNSKLGHLIVEWFAVSLVDLIKYRTWYVKNGIDPGNHFFKFQSQLVLSFLELRLPYQIPQAVQSQVHSLKDASYLFQLASSILETMSVEEIVTSSTSELTESINHACDTIMGEIVSFSKSSQPLPDSDWNDIQDGNLKLLYSLASKSDYSWMGNDDAAVHQKTYFFLIDCLGILPIKECEKTIICMNESRRKFVYELLDNYCAKNKVKSNAIRQYIRGVHTQLPPPGTFDFKPERDNKSATGYVGLRNMGSTCYMNSLLQVMYMNVDIRNYVINFFPQYLPDNISELDKKNNVFLQLKKMFYHLKWGEKKSYLPSDWAFAFKDEFGVNPINVMQQQDAQEFLQLFCDRIDQCHNTLLRRRNDATTPPSSNLLQGFFGGKLCNQMFQTSPPADGKPEIREQEESFVCISLEVKGVKNLEESLERFVAGEQINDYLWNESDKSSARENITKRQCISQLSNSIIFHLKRFELNFDTFRREKVNDLFPFPLTLDMRPYTKEGLAQSSSSSSEDNSYYEFELGAVVVHTGTADSGHYFSYIKEEIDLESEVCKSCCSTLSQCQCEQKNSPRKRRWLEFNDSEVSEFSESCIEAECFGGSTKSHEYHPSTQSVLTTDIVNPKSAYMLVYHRVKKSISIPTTVAVSPDTMESTPCSVAEVFDEMQKLKAQIEMENSTQILNVRMISGNHFNFYRELIGRVFEEFRSSNASGDELRSIVYDAFVLVFYYLSHTTLVTQYKEFAKLLLDMLNVYQAYHLRQKEIDANLQKQLAVKDVHTVPQVTGPFSSSPNNDDDDEEVILFGSDESKSSAPSAIVVATATNNGTSSLISTTPTVAVITVYQRMMFEFVHNIEKLESILFAGKEEIRAEIVAVILRVFSLTFEQEGKLAFLEQTFFDVSFGLLTGAVVEISAASATGKQNGPMAMAVPVVLGTIEEEEDEDLLLAIKMSQEGLPATASSTPEEDYDERIPDLIPVLPTTSVTSSGDIQLDLEASSIGPALESIAPTAVVSVEAVTDSSIKESQSGADKVKVSVASLNIFDDTVDLSKSDLYRALCPRFIIAITANEKMQYLTENWRKSASAQLLLAELAKLNSVIAEFLVSRQLISQIVDIILGNQSPLSGVLYEASKRKRAPTSYVSAHRTKDDILPIAARNAPDWTNFLSLLSVLVHYCKTQELYVVSKSIMSEWDSQCINTKTLYTTLLRQYRYVTPAVAIITQMSYGSKSFSDMICEVLFEEFSLTTTESMAHIFIVLESFLSISDSWTTHRCNVLFGGAENIIAGGVGINSGAVNNLNVLELIAGMKEQTAKVKFVCTFIRSFAALARQVGKVLIDTISKPAIRVSNWAPWMLKLVYRYQTQCSTGAGNVLEAIAASSTTTYPFLYVYGEEDCDREISWGSRAEKTFTELNNLIISTGSNPDTLIPDDTFAAVDGNGGVTNNSPTASTFKQGTMDDEALARYFETAESLGHELDID